jgi:hypothetical protein
VSRARPATAKQRMISTIKPIQGYLGAECVIEIHRGNNDWLESLLHLQFVLADPVTKRGSQPDSPQENRAYLGLSALSAASPVATDTRLTAAATNNDL